MEDLHPILVHLPLAFIPLGAVLGVWSMMRRGRRAAEMVYRYGAGVGKVLDPAHNVRVAPLDSSGPPPLSGSGGGD